MSAGNVLFVILVIAFFGLLAAGAIAAFVFSIIQQRHYDTTSLPDLGLGSPEDEEEQIAEKEDEIISESRFETQEEELVLEDGESNELMKNIMRASGTEIPNQRKVGLPSVFKTKTDNKEMEGQSNADSQ